MVNASDVREHMEVVGSDGQQVGTVDSVDGKFIKLSNSDPMAGGQSHYILLDAVDSVEHNRLRLRESAQDARKYWQTGELQPRQSEARSQSSPMGSMHPSEHSSEVF